MRIAAILAISGLLFSGCVPSDPGFPARGAAIASALAPSSPAKGAYFSGDRYVTADGTSLPLRRWLPEGEPSSVILALHGFNDYANAFALPAPALLAAGAAVYAYDQRGFGGAPHRGGWAGAQRMAADAADAALLLREQYPGRPLYLLGESMGGAVAVLAMTGPAAAPVDGLILAAPAVWGRQTMNLFERLGLWIADFVPSMPLSGRMLPITITPSDNLAMLRALSADPLVIKETRADTLNGLVDLMSAALAAAPRLRLPTLILYGEHDEIVPPRPLELFVHRLQPGAPYRLVLFKSGYHMLLRDLHAGLVLDHIAAWLHETNLALRSGGEAVARSAPGGQQASATARPVSQSQ